MCAVGQVWQGSEVTWVAAGEFLTLRACLLIYEMVMITISTLLTELNGLMLANKMTTIHKCLLNKKVENIISITLL